MKLERNAIYNNIQDAKERLYVALDILQSANEGNNQLDYVTDPKLSDQVDSLMRVANKVNAIMYQK